MEEPIFEPLNVFIDTSVIEGANFNFSSVSFQTLLSLATQGQISIFLSDVTTREVEAHLREAAKTAKRAHQSFHSKARVLRNLPYAPFDALFQPLEEEKVAKALIERFRQFLEDAEVEVIPIDNASASDVFNQYFSGAAPFDKGEKKHEFPDAFALSALRAHASELNERIYVVSADNGMKTACADGGPLVFGGTFEQFLDLVATRDALGRAIHQLIAQENKALSAEIERRFPELGFFLEDEWGDVQGVEVQQVRLSQPSVIKIEEQTAVIACQAELTFDADVEYDDLTNSIYDSEDDRYVVFDKVEKTVRRTVDVPVEAKLMFTISPSSDSGNIEGAIDKITDVEINHGEDISVYPDAEEDYH